MMEAKMPIICRLCEKFRIRPESAAIIVLWIAMLLVIIWAFDNGAYIVAAVGQTFAAAIGAAGAILVAILTHVLTQYREQWNEQQRALQANYMGLLDEIGKLIRTEEADDKFCGMHLKIRVVGTKNTIEKSAAMIDADNAQNRSQALVELIDAMREDVGLKKIKIEFPRKLFSAPKPPGVFVLPSAQQHSPHVDSG
jgi:hypothetical protein